MIQASGTQRRLIEKATNLKALRRAFRAEPLLPAEMEFYVDSLNARRGGSSTRRISQHLLQAADDGFFFKGVIFGNRGTGKSTEINRLLEQSAILERFAPIRMDATLQLNPQSVSVANVFILLMVNLIEGCAIECERRHLPFHDPDAIFGDIQERIAPFFPELHRKTQTTDTTGGAAELNLKIVKISIRTEGQRKVDLIQNRELLTGLEQALDALITRLREFLPNHELLVIGENFDKEAIPPRLLEETFVQYSALLQSLRLHFLFTLPVPFIYSNTSYLPFDRENRYPIYDVPVYQENNSDDDIGISALRDFVARRVDVDSLIDADALLHLIRGSGGDLYLLCALVINAGENAMFRHEDDHSTPDKLIIGDAQQAVAAQLSIFRNEMGTGPNDPDTSTWEQKRARLYSLYQREKGADVPDPVLYELIRRRAVLYCNGTGRYAVHPLAVQMLVEQLSEDPGFQYTGGGLTPKP